MKKELENRSDLDRFVSLFYEKLLADKSLSYLFTDVAKIELNAHLPVIADFWESILFGSNKYQGNPMQAHVHLNSLSPLRHQHFKRWLELFNESADELFVGVVYMNMKERAASIAQIMELKINKPA